MLWVPLCDWIRAHSFGTTGTSLQKTPFLLSWHWVEWKGTCESPACYLWLWKSVIAAFCICLVPIPPIFPQFWQVDEALAWLGASGCILQPNARYWLAQMQDASYWCGLKPGSIGWLDDATICFLIMFLAFLRYSSLPVRYHTALY